MKKLLLLTGCLALLSCGGPSPKTAVGGDDASQIKQALVQWARDFEKRDAAAVCNLFAPDAVVIYQDQPARDQTAICAQLRTALANPATQSLRYEEPRIDEMIITEGIAVVRLGWTLHVPTSSGVDQIIKENGVDVFRRQADGSWKIRISHAYPEH